MDTCKLNGRKPKMIAHRGVSKLERENTCAAFIAAGNRSYFGIETDVHVTADGQYVIIHDDTTTRVAGVEYVVEETDLATLRSLRLRDVVTEEVREDLCLPTLEEYISLCKKYDKIAVLELKKRMPEEAVRGIADVVRRMGHMEKTVFISFSLENLIDLRAYCPEQPAQYLLSSVADVDAMVETLKTYHLSLDVKYTALTREIVEKVHAAGLEVNVWTVDDPEVGAEMIALGVDYITSNILE